MNSNYTFPFGNKVHRVQQTDRTPKKVFVLGVYASAVHATWVSQSGRIVVRALAVASEPSIFWRGENAQRVIDEISIPGDLGTLTPAGEKYNGPSGRALDEWFLRPLKLDRNDTWLCDLLPETRLNSGQLKAISDKYNPKRKKYHLPAVTIPQVPNRFLDENRVEEILSEIRLADPNIIVLLGDQPIKWFLGTFSSHRKLSEFGTSVGSYGKVHPVNLNGSSYNFVPLVHPRQAAALGSHSVDWTGVHRTWTGGRAKEIVKEYLAD